MKRTKQQTEQLIFDEYTKICRLTFTHRESRPEPEPDILATLETGEQLAFELTRVDDKKVLEQESNEWELTQQLQAMRSQLKHMDDFKGFSFHVHFINQTFGQQKKLLPAVIDHINQNRPVPASQALWKNNKIVGRITAHKHKCDIQVQLGVGTGSIVGDYTVERIKKKIHDKHYVTTHPIHLLAWGVTMWPQESWQDDVTEIAREQNKFEKIWVFHYGRNLIVEAP